MELHGHRCEDWPSGVGLQQKAGTAGTPTGNTVVF